jgi:PAS domain S-box-containing protein
LSFTDQTAEQLADVAARTVERDPAGFHAVLNAIPAAIYVADMEGTITYFNQACIEAVGRRPEVGVDKWCVSWKLYTADGEELPHDRCPMAVAIKEGRPVRGVHIVAERPDGSRAQLIPYPTPLFDRDGGLCGAVNLLVDLSERSTPKYFEQRADQCRRLAGSVADTYASEMLALMAAKYSAQARRSEDQLPGPAPVLFTG